MHPAEEYLRNTANPPSLHVQIGGKRRRLFINRDQNQIGIVAPNKRKCGYLFTDWDSIEKVLYPSDHAPKSAEEANRQMVLKYQRLASKATFTGPYIKKALNPDPSKSLYENGLTTGTRIDGQVISLKAVEKWCGELTMQQFREALCEGKKFYSMRFDFRGYDGSLWVEPCEIEGDTSGKRVLNAGFSKEFRGCGNGYYYLLINDENFIGYDID